MKASERLAICLLVLIGLDSLPASAAPGNVDALNSADHLRRGLDFASRKYPEEAVGEFKKCSDFTRASAQQLRFIAQTYLEVGEPAACLKVIDYALSQKRVKDDKDQVAWLLDLRGTALASLNRTDQAVSAYKLAASTKPDMAYFYLAKAGELLMKDKKYKEALPFLNSGLKTNAMKGFVYKNIGYCYLELKEPAKASAPLVASISAFESYRKNGKTEAFLPGLIESHKYLVRVYKETGNRQEALVWQKRLDGLLTQLNTDFFGKR